MLIDPNLRVIKIKQTIVGSKNWSTQKENLGEEQNGWGWIKKYMYAQTMKGITEENTTSGWNGVSNEKEWRRCD